MKRLATLPLFALCLVACLSTSASAAGKIVISQVYGGGGNSGAVYTNDFVELHNVGDCDVNVTGWYLQYASATGTTWGSPTALTGVIKPGQFYLIQEAQGTGGTTPLPTPDAIGTIPMSATNGKVALATVSSLTGACPLGATVVDFVGFGTTPNCFEGVGPTGTALTNSTSATRKGGGCQDTDQNNADFDPPAAPTPRNSAAAFAFCGQPTGACCLRNTTADACVVTTPCGCESQGGIYLGDGSVCGTGACATDANKTTFGRLKMIYR
jgi:predicted extracellular nuclease